MLSNFAGESIMLFNDILVVLMKRDSEILRYLKVLLFLLLPIALATTYAFNPPALRLMMEFIRNDVKQPLRKTICLTASKIDYSGRENKYISKRDIREIKKVLKPGDIIFHRSESQLSNVAIPGFWTHTAIYIGGRDEINDYFKDINLPGYRRPSEYIERNYPRIFRRILLRRHLIIEAIGEGVQINPLDHFANADYFAAVRPVTDRDTLFRVLIKAFGNYGKPYDFFFDFKTDDAMICSEFVYKAYQIPGSGVRFSVKDENGKPFLTPNDIAQQTFDSQGDQSPMFHFVVFYCGDEQKGKAFKSDSAVFRLYAKK
jgi:hypothetical protein